MPLRILHITEAALGGVASHAGELIGWQRQQPENARVALAAMAGRTPAALSGQADAVHLYEGGRNPLRWAGTLQRLAAIVRAEAPDVIHLHSSFPGCWGRLLRLAGAGKQAAWVYTPHGWAFEQRMHSLKRAAYAGAEALLAPLADAVILISRHEEEAALGAGIAGKRLCRIPHTIPDAPARLEPLDGPLRIGFLGRFDRQKGFDLFCAAAAKLAGADMQFFAAGGFDREQRDAALPAAVTGRGWLQGEAVQDYLRGLDVLVMPSRWEGFGLAALEAYRAGTPVAAARSGALPEIVTVASGALFAPDDAAALESCLREKQAGWRAMRHAARARFEALSLARDCRAETQALYARLREKA